MTKVVGKIQYIVEANTGQLLKAEQEVQRAARSMDGSLKGIGGASRHVDEVTRSVENLGKEAKSSGNALTGMQKTLLGMATMGTALSIGKMADDYRTLTERVRFATESQEEYDIVQKRLIQSANESYRSLEEASEVFIGTSDNLRSLGFSLDETLDIADSLSFAFVKNATTTDRAKGALSAYDNALNKGAANTEDWKRINSAIPTLALDIAESLGVSIDAVLKMGNAGEISASLLNETLLKTFNSNREAATGMATTIQDAFINLKTNFSVFIGEANKTAGATDVVAKAIDLVSHNIETLATLMLATGAGAAAKYATSVGILTVAKMKATLATRANYAAELKNNKIAIENAKKAVDEAAAEVARTAALVAKGGAISKNTHALGAQAIAVANLDRAEKAAMVTTRGFMALLGGPAGIVGLLTLLVSGFTMFAASAKESDIEIKELTGSIEELTNKFIKMNETQRAAAIIEYGKEQRQAIKNLDSAYVDLARTVTRTSSKIIKLGEVGGQALRDYVEGAFDDARAAGGTLLDAIYLIGKELEIPQEIIDTWITQAEVVDSAETQLTLINDSIDSVNKAQKELGQSTKETTEELRKQAESNEAAGSALDKMTASLQSQMNTINDSGSAVKKLNREKDELIATEGKLSEENKKKYDEALILAEAIDAQKESTKQSSKEYEKATGVIASMQEELRLATLSGKELAIARAENQLNKFATEQEAQAVRNLASAIYDLQEAKKFGETDQEITATITGQVNPLSGGAFDDQVARYEAEMVAEQERYNAQLERLRQARELQLQTEKEFNDLEYNLQKTHAERMNQIDQARTTVMLQAYGSAFGSIADVMRDSQGEQSSAYQAMFAVSKAFALAEAGLNISTAISQALADPSAMTTAQKFANYAAIASAGAQIVSQIGGIQYGGGRQYGGPVASNKMYRVNETGEPEMFNAANGQQYFLPNQRGNVVPFSNSSQGSSSSGNLSTNREVNINFEITNHVSIEIRENETTEDKLMDVMDQISTKTQLDIVNSIRSNGDWSRILGR